MTMIRQNDHLQHQVLPSDMPISIGQALTRALYRSLLWQRGSGATASDAPPILAASFIPGPGAPSVEDLREVLRGAAHAFAHGGALLLLSDHARTREAARAVLLKAYPAAGRFAAEVPN
jgi:hypothetical protein